MFSHLGTSERTIVERMKNEFGVFYGKLITRFNRKPHSLWLSERNPSLFMCPDKPISKKDKLELADVTINDGIHGHGICLRPLCKTRMKEGLDQHIREEQLTYLRDSLLLRVQAKLITYDPTEAASYALKGYGKGHFKHGDLVLFPKSVSELPGRTFISHLNQMFISQFR
jgi:hypothetical protein